MTPQPKKPLAEGDDGYIPRDDAFVAVQKGEGVLVRNLKNGTCKWPLGTFDEVSKRFCGKPLADCNAVYCSGHKALAYQPRDRVKAVRAVYEPNIIRVRIPKEVEA